MSVCTHVQIGREIFLFCLNKQENDKEKETKRGRERERGRKMRNCTIRICKAPIESFDTFRCPARKHVVTTRAMAADVLTGS